LIAAVSEQEVQESALSIGRNAHPFDFFDG
jgi:hypothetical protein